MHARRINCKANSSPIQNDGNSWSSEKLTHDVYQNNLALPRASYRNNARSFFAHPPLVVVKIRVLLIVQIPKISTIPFMALNAPTLVSTYIGTARSAPAR